MCIQTFAFVKKALLQLLMGNVMGKKGLLQLFCIKCSDLIHKNSVTNLSACIRGGIIASPKAPIAYSQLHFAQDLYAT